MGAGTQGRDLGPQRNIASWLAPLSCTVQPITLGILLPTVGWTFLYQQNIKLALSKQAVNDIENSWGISVFKHHAYLIYVIDNVENNHYLNSRRNCFLLPGVYTSPNFPPNSSAERVRVMSASEKPEVCMWAT